MQAVKRNDLLQGRSVWLIELENRFDSGLTLLISKVSEAVLPATAGNHAGEGAAMDDIIPHQPGIRFMINGGFSHYRKNFYDWPHQNYNVGDPVGMVKIRDHAYEDFHDIGNYGFFVQEQTGQPWKIVRIDELNKHAKYILGCTPLLIHEKQPMALPLMRPLGAGIITPPSNLAHGHQNHPRTAIGIRGDKLIFVIVEGDKNTGGCTLPELQELGVKLEAEHFLNLDGGGSSQFRLWNGSSYTRNSIAPEDEKRVLGHVLILFDESLKSQANRLT